MYELVDASVSVDEVRRMEAQFAERTRRLGALLELDDALSAAANRYSLAAQVVRHGWPHRAD